LELERDEEMRKNFFRYITLIVLAGLMLFWVVGTPTGASFNPATQTFRWIADYEQAGNYTVFFQVVDDGMPAEVDSEEITIIVGNVNRPPILATIGNKTVNQGETLTFVVTGSDPDGDDLAYSATNIPVGAVFDAATQTFAWTPTHEQAGSYNVTFTVSDNGIPPKLDSEGITITVISGGVPRIFFPVGPT
jgi:hypothetical protein